MTQPMHILLVEDNAQDRELMNYLLSARFPPEVLQITEAHNLASALTTLDKGGINCVILDLALPDSTGPETFFRVNERHFDVPIIVMTHTKDRQLAIDMIQAGASDFIIKNFTDEEETFNRILMAIKRYEAQKRTAEEEGLQLTILRKLDAQALETSTLVNQLNQLRQKLSVPPIAFEDDPQEISFGQRAAEKVAQVVGSWRFILIQSSVILVWIVLNNIPGFPHWDGYPFILMNWMLSLQAAYTAPLIMMAQNRLSQKDRLIARTDYEISHQGYQVNQQTQSAVQAMQAQVDQQNQKLDMILKRLQRRKSFPNLQSIIDEDSHS